MEFRADQKTKYVDLYEETPKQYFDMAPAPKRVK